MLSTTQIKLLIMLRSAQIIILLMMGALAGL